MAARKAEQVLAALFAAIDAGKPAGASATRNKALPVKIPAPGHAGLFDGEPGQPEVTLSPPTWHFEHVAEVELAVEAASATVRDAAFDTYLQAIDTAIAADRTLGGLCDWAEAGAPRPSELPLEGAETIKAGVVPVTLHYATTQSIG